MKSFSYERPDRAPIDSGATLLAGGTDLLPLLKRGLVTASHVVDIKHSELDGRIEPTDEGGWRLGALATLADLERGPLADELPVIADAVRQAATRQIRNRATVAGNLLQRSRCPYFRDPHIDCWLEGGDGCPARDGRHEHHAIFDTGPCVTTHPSDLVNALVALDARVHTTAGTMPLEDLLAPPTEGRRRLHDLPDGAVVTAIEIPGAGPVRSAYRKAMDRAAWAFALVGVAAVVRTGDDDSVTDARVVAGGVAASPWRLPEVEAALLGQRLEPDVIVVASERAGSGAAPLPRNAYKVPLLQGLTRRTLESLR